MNTLKKVIWNKQLTLVPTDERKDSLKKYKKLWTETKDLIRTKINKSDDYYEKYMKIKSNSDDGLLLKKR